MKAFQATPILWPSELQRSNKQMLSESSTPRSWLVNGTQTLGLNLSDTSIEQLLVYFAELKKWSKKINLIGQASDQSIIENHFLDSLTLLPLLPSKHNDRFLDIGSGAGFPGLVLKIAAPELNTTLVEPRQKRVAFLKHICRTVGMADIKVICSRIHKNDTNFSSTHGPFSCITSRAVANVKEFLSLTAPLCSEGCIVLCMKGPQADIEVEEWQQSESKHLFSIQETRQFQLPFSHAVRNLIVFTRTSRK